MWLIFSSLFVLAANNIRVCSLDQLESENDLAEVATVRLLPSLASYKGPGWKPENNPRDRDARIFVKRLTTRRILRVRFATQICMPYYPRTTISSRPNTRIMVKSQGFAEFSCDHAALRPSTQLRNRLLVLLLTIALHSFVFSAVQRGLEISTETRPISTLYFQRSGGPVYSV